MLEFMLWAAVYLIIGFGVACLRKVQHIRNGYGYRYDEDNMAVATVLWPVALAFIFFEYVGNKLEEYFDPDKK